MRALVVAAMVMTSAAATDPEIYRLKSEVAQLRNEVRRLEQQVRALEAQMRARRAPPAPAAIVPVDPWQQLRLGLGKDQVERLLGQPSERAADAWHYERRGEVRFDAAGRVSGWTPP